MYEVPHTPLDREVIDRESAERDRHSKRFRHQQSRCKYVRALAEGDTGNTLQKLTFQRDT